MYEEYRQYHFVVDGQEGILICPQTAREDRKYIWRTEFLGAFDYADRELLKRGWHLAYYKVSDQFGAPQAIRKMREFQEYLENVHHLAAKAVLFGFSRGGLYAVNYAAAYPEKTAKLYLDAPVLDIFSWPGGLGRGEGSEADWEICRKLYQVQEGQKEAAENPINKMKVLIQNRIPVLLIAGQSNSAGYGRDYISDCLDAGVHLLKNNGKWDIASHPMNDSTGTIHPQNRDGANTGHGMYLSFAKYLKRELGYPIGLVQASLGGSPLKAWSAENGYLYRSMIHIVRGLNGIKGILWYQGCSDTSPEDSRTLRNDLRKWCAMCAGQYMERMKQICRIPRLQTAVPGFQCCHFMRWK